MESIGCIYSQLCCQLLLKQLYETRLRQLALKYFQGDATRRGPGVGKCGEAGVEVGGPLVASTLDGQDVRKLSCNLLQPLAVVKSQQRLLETML
jgi:hypothetical protein